MKLRKLFLSISAVSILSLTLFSYFGIYKGYFISKSLSSSFELPVTVGSMTFSTRSITLHDVRIQNPPGCSSKDAFYGKTVEFKTTLPSVARFLFSPSTSNISFNEIKISNPEVNLELFSANGHQNNWTHILSNLSSHKQTETSHNFSIDNTIFSNVQVEIIHSHIYEKAMRPPHIGRIQIQEYKEFKKLPKQEMLLTFFGLFIKRLSSQLGFSSMFSDLEIGSISQKNDNELQRIAHAENTTKTLRELFGRD